MAGGLIALALAFFIVSYLVYDKLRPYRGPAVDSIIAIRRGWKKFYGWTYLERPIGSSRSTLRYHIGNFLLDRLNVRDHFATQLEQAGLEYQPQQFIFWHMTVTLIIGFSAYFIEGWFLAIFFIIFGAVLPLIILPVLVKRRKTLIEDQLAETLQLIGSLLKAGHGFPQALAAVTKETQPPISLILKKVSAQVNLGSSLEDSLDKMARDVGSLTLGWAVTAIRIQREVGGNLSEILDILSGSIRERGELARQVKALTAEGRLSAYILLVMPFILGVILYYTNPTYMALLWETTPGIVMLTGASILMTIGSVWLWKLVKVEV